MTTHLTATEYRLLVEHSPVLVWRAGKDAKCDYFNDTWLAFTGRRMDQELGDGWAEGVHPEDLDRCVRTYLDHFRRCAPFEMEYRLRRHDGIYRWIFDRGVPYSNERGFAGFIGSCVDIDDRRRAQAEKDQLERDQLAMARQFGQWVLSFVSHQIRKPLSAIHGSARVLAARAANDSPVLDIAERITRSTSHITHLVGDLLNVARTQKDGGIPVLLAPAEMNAICARVVEEVAATYPHGKIRLEASGDVAGTWDPERVAQALSNLVQNALQHGSSGSPVRVTVRGDGERVTVDVHDDGTIPSDRLATLFEPFAGRTAAGDDSLGLGLFIARAIARAHQGDIDVTSAPDHGTSFRLTLPRHARALPRPPGISAA